MNIEMISVGSPFPKDVKIGIPGIIYNEDGTLGLFMKDTGWSSKEIKSASKEAFSIMLIEKNDVYGLLVEFTEFSFECYFNINNTDNAKELVNSFNIIDNEDLGIAVTVYIIDEKNIVRSIRLVGLNNDMSNDIVKVLHKQFENINGVYDADKSIKGAIALQSQYNFRQLKEFAISRTRFSYNNKMS